MPSGTVQDTCDSREAAELFRKLERVGPLTREKAPGALGRRGRGSVTAAPARPQGSWPPGVPAPAWSPPLQVGPPGALLLAGGMWLM